MVAGRNTVDREVSEWQLVGRSAVPLCLRGAHNRTFHPYSSVPSFACENYAFNYAIKVDYDYTLIVMYSTELE